MPLQDETTLFFQWSTLLKTDANKKRYREYIDEWEKKIGSFLSFNPDIGLGLSEKSGKGGETDGSLLKGVPFAVKDNIAVKGFPLTCGSKMLESFVSPYTATAVNKLISAGAVPVGKTNLDEFGMGSSNENSALGTTLNPWDPRRVTGGSSGGSAAAVAAGLVPFALGSDTGGSVRQPAAFCGVFGLKPTYGVVSRYGLVAYASSLEVIGILSRSVSITRSVFNEMKGYDPWDQSSLEHEPEGTVVKKSYRIGVFKGSVDADEEIKKTFYETCKRVEALGWEIKEIEFPHMEYMVPAYYTIATAEASANLARYTGIRYGLRPDTADSQEELVKASRTEGFGEEVKLRILLGTYVLRSGFQDQYYVRAQKIRTAIRNDYHRAFSDVDMMLTPVFPVQAFEREEGGGEGLDAFQQKLADRYTCSANLTGMPALSFPTPLKNGLPVGMQLLAPPFCEERLFHGAAALTEDMDLPFPPGFKDMGRL